MKFKMHITKLHVFLYVPDAQSITPLLFVFMSIGHLVVGVNQKRALITNNRVRYHISKCLLDCDFSHFKHFKPMNFVFIGSDSGGNLDFEALTNIQASLANEMQSGSLGESLDITITSMEMTEPVEEPVDPTGGVRATNATGGPANGTTT